MKSRKFQDHRYIGDPMNAVSLFNAFKADELIFLDISASPENREISCDLVREIGIEANMPFSVGGGLRSLEGIRRVIAAGAERVVLGTSVLERPDFLASACQAFGSSTVAVCLDVVTSADGEALVYSRAHRSRGSNVLTTAKQIEELGAGELILQSVDRDGMQNGYNMELTRQVSAALKIPVVVLGGAGHPQHLIEVYQRSHVSGVAAGSLFVYHGANQGVLINYPSRQTIHKWFRDGAGTSPCGV